jgi:hypothetical protein
MGLLDGAIAETFASVFGPMYLDATLHRALPRSYDGGGTLSPRAFIDEDVKAQLDFVTESMRLAAGYTDKDQRIFVLAHDVRPIGTDDEITIGDQRWAIAGVNRDPAGAYYELRGQRA